MEILKGNLNEDETSVDIPSLLAVHLCDLLYHCKVISNEKVFKSKEGTRETFITELAYGIEKINLKLKT